MAPSWSDTLCVLYMFLVHRYDKFYVSANGKYPLLCGENSGQHIYLGKDPVPCNPLVIHVSWKKLLLLFIIKSISGFGKKLLFT